MPIPKIIHQIWIGNNKQPTVWTDTFAVDYIREYPEWKYVLWSEKNIDELFVEFPVIKLIYDKETTYNGKSDILRYLILYKHGGVYIDADSVWVNNKCFDDLLNQVNSTECFLAYEPENRNVCGGVMGASQFNKYVKLMIEGVENIVKYGNKINIRYYVRKRNIHGPCEIIGPMFLDRLYKTFDEKITIFPSIYFYPISWHGVQDLDAHKKIDIPKESYTFQFGYTTNALHEKS